MNLPQKAEIRESEKTKIIDELKNFSNAQNNYGFKKSKCNYPKNRIPERDYYGFWISYEKDPWIFVCWANEFENKYLCTPFWIELDEKATEEFFKCILYKEFCFCRHPRITEQIIIPVFIEEMANIEQIAKKALYIADKTVRKDA